MIQKLKVTFLLVTVLAASSCSELEDAVNSNLSTNQITYKVETLNEWNKVESSAKQARTRAAMPADGDVVKRVNGWSGPLYLHALEEPGIHIRDYKDRPVNKQGQLLADENTGRIIATRGSKVTNTSLTDFGINVKRVSSDNNAETFIDNEEVKTVVDSKYKTSADHFWPSDNTRLNFYGYYPYNSGDYSKYIFVNNTGATPVITYKSTAGNTSATATEVKGQPDLCVATKPAQTRPSTSAKPDAVDMTFNHALTAITFAVGSDMVPGTFKSITVSGVYLEGDYTYDSGWSTANKPTGSITLTLNGETGIYHSSKEAVALTGRDSTLLMVPQKVPSGATISMLFNDGNGDKTFTANIGGTEWTSGSTIIYKLSTQAVNNMTLGTITFPNTWTAAGYPKTDYASDESMGLYSVDDLGNLRAQNVKITYNGKSWTPATSVRFSPAFKYFVYYPYNAEMSSSSVTSTATTAEQFFGKYTNTPSADQSTSLSALTSNDLQIGVGTADNTGSNVNFAAANMKHMNGLAVVNLNAKTVPQTYYYDGNTGKASSVRAASTTTATVWPSVNFSSSTKPYSSSNTSSLKRYLAIVKSSTTTTISTTATSGCEAWSLSYNVSQNTSLSQSVTSSRPGYYLGWVFGYTGAAQTLNAQETGKYKVECWGASGGSAAYDNLNAGYTTPVSGGAGGYCSGEINLKDIPYYIYVGHAGSSYHTETEFNGGGGAGSTSNYFCSSGGGATDFRLTYSSDWSNFESLKSRIMVAAGGGGAQHYLIGSAGGYGGGLIGGSGHYSSDPFYDSDILPTGGTQTAGGAGGKTAQGGLSVADGCRCLTKELDMIAC